MADLRKKDPIQQVGSYEPYGLRKGPSGAFSRKAVADLLGQAMNGEEIARPAGRAFFENLLIPGSDTGNQKGNSALCGARLRALP